MYTDNQLGHVKYQSIETDAKCIYCVYYQHKNHCPDSNTDVTLLNLLNKSIYAYTPKWKSMFSFYVVLTLDALKYSVQHCVCLYNKLLNFSVEITQTYM